MDLKYYVDMEDVHLSGLLRKANIKTKNWLIALYGYSWQYFPYTGRSTEAYIIFYQGDTIYHGAHVPGPVAQSSSENEYNVACTAGMDLAHFMMLIHELLNKGIYIVP